MSIVNACVDGGLQSAVARRNRRPGASLAEVEPTTTPKRRGDSSPAITVSLTGASKSPWRFVVLWMIGWTVVGTAVGLVIVATQGSFAQLGPIMKQSVLFAQVVGITALFSSRLMFPYYASLPYIPRLLLQIATVGGGAFLGTAVVLMMGGLFTIHNIRIVLVMIVVNTALALLVGIGVNTYESMKRQIERSFEDLRKREAFDREMEIAREVQEQLFPKSDPKVLGLEVAGVCLPAAGVGGDYYDYLSFSDSSLGLVVADVSGKGISAALLMASLQASVRNVIGPDTHPSEANQTLNQILYRATTASRYATLFLGLFDGRNRLLRYSNAGHNPPMILRGGSSQKLSEGGLPLGILDGSHYFEGSRTLEPGDLLLMYTDGAVEAADPSGREFGLDRLVASASSRSNGENLRDLVQHLVADVQKWTHDSPQQDDITLVLARAA